MKVICAHVSARAHQKAIVVLITFRNVNMNKITVQERATIIVAFQWRIVGATLFVRILETVVVIFQFFALIDQHFIVRTPIIMSTGPRYVMVLRIVSTVRMREIVLNVQIAISIIFQMITVTPIVTTSFVTGMAQIVRLKLVKFITTQANYISW